MSLFSRKTWSWDPEVGEHGLKTRSRRQWDKREKSKMDALKEKNEQEAFEVPETFCCASYDPARYDLLYCTKLKQFSGLDASWQREVGMPRSRLGEGSSPGLIAAR